jgi:hypothetical protein
MLSVFGVVPDQSHAADLKGRHRRRPISLIMKCVEIGSSAFMELMVSPLTTVAPPFRNTIAQSR